VSVGLSVTLVSHAKTAELIATPFGLKNRVGPGNYLLDGSRSTNGKGQFSGGNGVSHCKL